MTKILFVHNTPMWYRRPFFKLLTQIYSIKFVFTHIEISSNVYGVELSGNIEGLEEVNYKIINPSKSGRIYKIINDLAKEDYDIIVDSFLSIESFFSFVIAKLRRKHIIFWSEAWDWERKNNFKEALLRLLFKFVLSHSSAIFVPGTRHKKYFLSLGAKSNQIFILPNVSNIYLKNIDHKNKNELKKELNIGSKKVILYVGRLEKRKGVEYLVRGFAKLLNDYNDTVLIIIGRGECRNHLESLSKSLNVSNCIYFRGYVEDELLPAYYLLSDICVIPSITYMIGDPWVFTVNEAMYFGKPVIVTDAVGAAFDMIEDGKNGFLVKEKSSDELYHAMKKILSDPELKQRMGEESKRIIEERYTYDNMINGFKSTVDYLLKQEEV